MDSRPNFSEEHGVLAGAASRLEDGLKLSIGEQASDQD
jgi:hypothetical protein